jgi:NAD(P)-dependent dehydrogenase (short-subunit alcohol dehydrogenase family)
MKSRFTVSGRVAVVTGALGQLGTFWTRVLLEEGASVAALDRRAVDASDEFTKLAREAGGRLLLVRADVRSRRELERARTACLTRLGAPAILVNNAGIDQPPARTRRGWRIEDVRARDVLDVLDVNTVGMFQCAQVFGAEMVARRTGSIINIASLYALVSPDARLYDHIEMDPPFLKPPAYGASKAAVVNLTKYLATHWASSGVRVNAMSPGGVHGSQDAQFVRKYRSRVPMRRMAVVEDLAGPLLFLASEASRYVTGINLVVDGGFTAW